MDRKPEVREDDSWFSDEQLGSVARADGLKGARIFKLKPAAPVAQSGLYKPVPADFERRIPDDLKRRLADEPGYRGYTELLPQDNFSTLKSDYAEAGGLRENVRYGWVRRS
jgi:hypothetical protein